MPFIQASSDCKGGASGSPVISQSGFAVAMVSGGNLASTTNFFLPLDRPQRALESLLNGQAILRGTIQSNWIRETRAECFALGLKNQTFEKYCPGGGGLLKAHKILPEGSSNNKIREGDLLLRVNGQNVISLAAFEDSIDRAVGSSITIELWRQGLDHEVVLDVKNLFTLVPYQVLEYAGSLFQDLRYDMALVCYVPLRGLFFLAPGVALTSKIVVLRLLLSIFNPHLIFTLSLKLPEISQVSIENPHQLVSKLTIRSIEGRNPVPTPQKPPGPFLPNYHY